ncbi:hypothetical protein LY78DRAFT_654840 [Colletotrichum sublineola]|nr:hypothetical protein LY78DRAFT_654840 [Colletotrichum sublineola]
MRLLTLLRYGVQALPFLQAGLSTQSTCIMLQQEALDPSKWSHPLRPIFVSCYRGAVNMMSPGQQKRRSLRAVTPSLSSQPFRPITPVFPRFLPVMDSVHACVAWHTSEAVQK